MAKLGPELWEVSSSQGTFELFRLAETALLASSIGHDAIRARDMVDASLAQRHM